jgi:archaellum component FlaC
MIENSIKHIQNALKELDKEMEKIVMDFSLSLKEKDNLMLPIVLEKKILTQTIDDLRYLQDNPPPKDQPCGIAKYREDN